MERREFFTAPLASAGLGAAPAAPDEFPATERDAHGFPVCFVYRVTSDGKWLQNRPQDVKVGDRIVLVGVDAGRLWRCLALTVTKVEPPSPRNSGLGAVCFESEVDLLAGAPA